MIQDIELFQTLLKNLSDGVYFVDPHRIIQYWNPAAERISGYSEAEIAGKSYMDDIFVQHKEGHRLPVRVSTAAIRNKSGAVIGGLETFHDDSAMVAALKEVEHLTELSLICPLTNLGNRRYSEETLAKRLAEVHRHSTLCSVMMFDVDHFKRINDTYGHPAGDTVLRMVARTLVSDLRPYDFAGRWGGEEFLVIMPHFKPRELEPVANRLRVLVERAGSKNRVAVTVSGGATLSRIDDTPASIVARVDKLLYDSKKRGRNRITND
ncbi:MAG: diguanylate cyclase [Candidatus Hydrogenedentes bacterium]|nr:diguanylate cyclase [Candidatus Hydrogenedentota bacterium]